MGQYYHFIHKNLSAVIEYNSHIKKHFGVIPKEWNLKKNENKSIL